MLRNRIILLTAGLLSACGTGPVGNRNVPEPAKAVELDRYLGKWYEMARYENRFEKGCEAITAEYARRDDGLVSILNTCRRGGAGGPVESAEGKARIVENSGGAKLEVSFFGPFYLGDYWVLDHAENYSWSIVGEPSGRYLWLLTRQPLPAQEYREMLVGKIKSLGYDTSLLYFPKQPPKD